MPFPKGVKTRAAIACNRCCCICHEFKGVKLEFHHIKPEASGGDNSFENCIPLCFDCHADMGRVNSAHPKGNSYSEAELKMHRDRWYEKVQCPERLEYVTEFDRQLFHKICGILNDRVLFELRYVDYRGTFSSDQLFDVRLMLDNSELPGWQFDNDRLEELRKELFGALDRFSSFLALNTFGIKDVAGRSAARIWHLEHHNMRTGAEEYDDYREKHYDQFMQEAMEMNRLASTAWEYCNAFLKQGRKIINN